MPSTRARTCATRNADVRPGSSIDTGTDAGCTVTTVTWGGGGVVVVWALELQPAASAAATASRAERTGIFIRPFHRPAVSSPFPPGGALRRMKRKRLGHESDGQLPC